MDTPGEQVVMTEEIPPVVYRDWSLADLDWLHDDQGLAREWLASPRRADLAAHTPEPAPMPEPTEDDEEAS